LLAEKKEKERATVGKGEQGFLGVHFCFFARKNPCECEAFTLAEGSERVSFFDRCGGKDILVALQTTQPAKQVAPRVAEASDSVAKAVGERRSVALRLQF